jgi:uncharacterized protein YutE (UPF0331/DUF86 family)
MENLDTLNGLLNNLRNYQAKLHQLADYRQRSFLSDFTKIESAKHLLQVSIQSCLDIAHHIIAKKGYRTPQDSYDAFVVLHEQAIFPDDFMPVLRQMVSFRNRIVHLYWDVNDETVYQIVQSNLKDFDTYTEYILDFVYKK